MKTLLIIFAIVVLEGATRALPFDAKEEDFSIDMYEGSRHLRYERSTENVKDKAAASGTVVTVETGKDAAQAKIEKVVKEPLKLDEALKLVKTVDKMQADKAASAAAAAAAAVPTSAAAIASVAAAAAAPAKAAVAPASAAAAAPAKTAAAPVTTANAASSKTAADSTSISSSSSVVSTPIKYKDSSATTDETAIDQTSTVISQPRYINQYGNVLYRINNDMAQPLTSSKYKGLKKSSFIRQLFGEEPESAARPLSNNPYMSHIKPTVQYTGIPNIESPNTKSSSVVTINGIPQSPTNELDNRKIYGTKNIPDRIHHIMAPMMSPRGFEHARMLRLEPAPVWTPQFHAPAQNIRMLNFSPRKMQFRF